MDNIKKLLGVLVFLTGCATSTPQQQGLIWTNDLQDVDKGNPHVINLLDKLGF